MMDMDEDINRSADFFRIFDHTPAILNDTGTEIPAEEIKGVIKFDNVTFAYPTSPAVKILKNLSCTIKEGQTVAFVGGSGSGKSTIIRLLMRLYDPDKGAITVDGYNLKDINLPWFHHNVTAIVSQNPDMFEGTVEENIRYAKDDATEEQVIDAAKLADADKFVRDKDIFPDEYATLVGEKGVKLSGG